MEELAANNRKVSPEQLMTLIRRTFVVFSEMICPYFSVCKREAVILRRAARLVVQRRIRGTA